MHVYFLSKSMFIYIYIYIYVPSFASHHRDVLLAHRRTQNLRRRQNHVELRVCTPFSQSPPDMCSSRRRQPEAAILSQDQEDGGHPHAALQDQLISISCSALLCPPASACESRSVHTSTGFGSWAMWRGSPSSRRWAWRWTPLGSSASRRILWDTVLARRCCRKCTESKASRKEPRSKSFRKPWWMCRNLYICIYIYIYQHLF